MRSACRHIHDLAEIVIEMQKKQNMLAIDSPE